MSINLVIFSKDRPAQLFALLESIEKNTYGFDPRILYKATTPEFEEGYEVVKKHFGKPPLFFKEKDFRDDLSGMLHGKYIAFATDDGIFFRDIRREITFYEYALWNKDVACISLRLGVNTPRNNYYSNGIGQYYPVPFKKYDYLHRTKSNEDNVPSAIQWNWKASSGNFAYPLSVDAHIFRSETIIPLIDKVPFDSPNSLEGNLQSVAHELPPLMIAPEKSAYVGNSVNRTQNIFQNYAGGVHPISTEELNRMFLQGYRIDWERFPYEVVRSPHHEFEIGWK